MFLCVWGRVEVKDKYMYQLSVFTLGVAVLDSGNVKLKPKCHHKCADSLAQL